MTSARAIRAIPDRALRVGPVLVLLLLASGLAAIDPRRPQTPPAAPARVEIALEGAERLQGEVVVYLARAGENRARLWQRLRLPAARSVVFEGLDQVLFLTGHELEVGVASRGPERCATRFRLGGSEPPGLDLSALAPLEVRVRGTAALGALDHLGIAEGGLSWVSKPWLERPEGARFDQFDIEVDRLFPGADGRSFRGFTRASAGHRRLEIWITGVADQSIPLAFASFEQLALDSRLPPVELAALRGVRARILGRRDRIAQVLCESLSDHENRIPLAATAEDGLFASRATIARLVPATQLDEPIRVVVEGLVSDASWSYICGDGRYDDLRAELDLSLGADSVMGMDCGFGLPEGMSEAIFANVITRSENGELIARRRIELSGQQRHVEIPPLVGRRSLVFSNRRGSLVSPVYPVIADANYRVRLRPAHRLAIEFSGLEALRPFEPFLILRGSAPRSAVALLEVDHIRFPMRDVETVLPAAGPVSALVGIPRHGRVEIRGLVPGDLQVFLGWRGGGGLMALPTAAFSLSNERVAVAVERLLAASAPWNLINRTSGFLAKDGVIDLDLPPSWARRLGATRIPPGGVLPVLASGRASYCLDESGLLRRYEAVAEPLDVAIDDGEIAAPVEVPLCPPDLQLERLGAGSFHLRIRPALPAEIADLKGIFADWPDRIVDFDGPEVRITLAEEGRYAVEVLFESYLRMTKPKTLTALEDVGPAELRARIAAGWPWVMLR